MLQKFFATEDDVGALIARLALGIMIFPHGAQKLLGWWGGGGFSGTMEFFSSQGMPSVLAFLLIIGEFFGGLGLIYGFIGRFCAASIGMIMLGAVGMVHFQNGFFMNWSKVADQGEGFEFHILAIGLALIVVIKGSGKWSADAYIAGKIG